MSKRVLYILFAAFFAFLALLCVSFPPHFLKSSAATKSAAECVIEPVSRRFLFEYNAGSALPMASTTKILTAAIILDDCDLQENVTVPKQAEGTEGSSVYLRAGDCYTVLDLLYGLMLRSGNDCAVTLALHHSGDIQTFAEKMNEKAALLGAEQSRFVNPHGLPAEGHYTTARDLALIAAYAMENETFREIVSTKYYAERGWANKNKMLRQYDGATGIKTGFTVSAGRCLVTSAERNGMRLVCVTLNSPQMYERTEELLDNAYRDYRMVALCDHTRPVEGLRAYYDFNYPLTQSEMNEVRTEVRHTSNPQKEGDFAGQMQIFLKNDLIFSQNLYMIER